MSEITYFVYIWEFIVKKEFFNDFKKSYGPNGIWVNFFNKSENYLKTELLIDKKNNLKFVTIDYWKSKEKYLDFIFKNKIEYDKIDQDCNNYTLEELKIGEFDIISD